MIPGWRGAGLRVAGRREAGRGMPGLLLAFVIWICSLPVIAWFVVPRWGSQAAFAAGLAAGAVILAICLAVCRWPDPGGQK